MDDMPTETLHKSELRCFSHVILHVCVQFLVESVGLEPTTDGL